MNEIFYFEFIAKCFSRVRLGRGVRNVLDIEILQIIKFEFLSILGKMGAIYFCNLNFLLYLINVINYAYHVKDME